MNKKTDKETDEIIDAIAEQWVELVLAHIKTRKQEEERGLEGKN